MSALTGKDIKIATYTSHCECCGITIKKGEPYIKDEDSTICTCCGLPSQHDRHLTEIGNKGREIINACMDAQTEQQVDDIIEKYYDAFEAHPVLKNFPVKAYRRIGIVKSEKMITWKQQVN